VDAQERVHLVGSVPLDDCEQVFREVSASLGDRLARIPDGETGERTNWVGWQLPRLLANPNLEIAGSDSDTYTGRERIGLSDGANPANLSLGDLGYADAAKASYAVFNRLQRSGEIPAHVRFQVCLPTPVAISHLFIASALQADFEAQYETRLLQELDDIVAAIPATELAVQWDTAVEFALLEGVMPTYIEDVYQGVVERLLRLCAAVPVDVEMGLHLCYGDSGHRHFCEPEDMGHLVAVANAIVEASPRPVHWIHMPVPRERDDEAYFRPLAQLELPPVTRLYLGLVHYGDGEPGVQRRCAAAGEFAADFGIATECGFGRRPQATVARLMELHKL
jgi:hypothetical protein